MKLILFSLLCVGLVMSEWQLPPPNDACIHKGERYEIGQRVPVDSCNTCICGGYGIACTLMACREHMPPGTFDRIFQ